MPNAWNGRQVSALNAMRMSGVNGWQGKSEGGIRDQVYVELRLLV